MYQVDWPSRVVITYHQLEILLLLKQGLSKREICSKLGVSTSEVYGSVRRIRENWVHLPKFMKVINEKSLWEVIEKEGATKSPMRWVQRKFEEGYHIGTPPYGYRKDERDELVEKPEEKKVVIKLFTDADNNKSIGQLSRDSGLLKDKGKTGSSKDKVRYILSKDKVRYILQNPVYKGMIRWMGDARRGRHDPMVDSELFDRVQEKLKGGRKFGFRSLPSEYYYDLQGRVCLNLEKVERIKRLWQLRLKKLNRAEIADELEMTAEEVRWKLRNPFYAAKKEVEGEWFDMDHEPIVDFDTWVAANRVVVTRTDAIRKTQAKRKRRNMNKVVAALGSRRERTCSEISKDVNLSMATVYKRLYDLEKEGSVKRIPPVRERKGVSFPTRWQFQD